jgi:hypothetical protein
VIFDHLANFRSEQMQDQNIALNDAMILPFHANPARMKFSKRRPQIFSPCGWFQVLERRY